MILDDAELDQVAGGSIRAGRLVDDSHTAYWGRRYAGMFLSDEDEDKVEKAETKEEAKKVIEDAGMILDDAELDKVAGGSVIPSLPGSRPADL